LDLSTAVCQVKIETAFIFFIADRRNISEFCQFLMALAVVALSMAIFRLNSFMSRSLKQLEAGAEMITHTKIKV